MNILVVVHVRLLHSVAVSAAITCPPLHLLKPRPQSPATTANMYADITFEDMQNVCLERRGLPHTLEGVVLQFLHLIVRIAPG